MNGGYALGGIIVGLGYSSMGWVGLNLFSAVFALAALVFVVSFHTPVDRPQVGVAGTVAGAKAGAAGGNANAVASSERSTRSAEDVGVEVGGGLAAAGTGIVATEEAAAAATSAAAIERSAGRPDEAHSDTRDGSEKKAHTESLPMGSLPPTPLSPTQQGAAAAAGASLGIRRSRSGVESVSDGGSGGGSNKGSARAAFRSGAMASHCYTAFSAGYQFTGFLVVFVLMAKQELGWSPTLIGWSFLAIPVANILAMYLIIPRAVRAVGVHGLITYSSACFGGGSRASGSDRLRPVGVPCLPMAISPSVHRVCTGLWIDGWPELMESPGDSHSSETHTWNPVFRTLYLEPCI